MFIIAGSVTVIFSNCGFSFAIKGLLCLFIAIIAVISMLGIDFLLDR